MLEVIRRWRLGPVLGSVAVATLAQAGIARADDSKAECLVSFERAQRLRHDGKLTLARADLRTCARASCPDVIQTKCAEWAPQVEAAVPTVIVSAREAVSGADHLDATLFVDGVRVAGRLDGKPMEMDPGRHVIAIVPTRPGGRAPQRMELTIQVVESEKGRLVRFVWPEEPASPAVAVPAHGPTRGAPVAAYVLGGLSVVALASFAGFGGSGLSDYLYDKSHCAPKCDPAGESSLRTKFVIADVSLGVSLVSAAVGGWLFFRHRSERGADAPTVEPVLHVGLDGARGGLEVQF